MSDETQPVEQQPAAAQPTETLPSATQPTGTQPTNESRRFRWSWSSLTRAERRKFRTIAIAVGTAAAVLALTVVVIVVAVGDRSGTIVSQATCSNTTAGNLRFEPTTGPEGTAVYITGENFADVTDVTFNGKSVNSFSVVSPTEITTAVPGGAITGPIVIVSKTTPITSDTCFTTTSPAVTSFSPATGAAGTRVTITGANFTGATAVKFNGLRTTPASVTATAITVTVPPNAVTGLVAVETPVSTGVATGTFSVSSAAITEFSPALGAPGTEVTITGANLSSATAVRFGTTPATSFKNVSATSIRATVPPNVATGPISVSTPAGTATASADFAAAPTITSFAPATVSPGSTVTITGTNLGSVTSVEFVGSVAAAAFTIDSPTQITATVPADAVSGQVSVQGTALAVSSTPLIIGPSITSIWPTTGAAGTVVTITGTNLFRLSGVTFNGIAATFQEVSLTQATATVPAGSAAGTVTVRAEAGSATSPVAFGAPTSATLPTDPQGPVSVPTVSSGSSGTTTTSPGTTTPTTTAPSTTAPATTATTAPATVDTAPNGETSSTVPTETSAPESTTAESTTTVPAGVQPPASLSGGRIVLSNVAGTSAPTAAGELTWSGTADASFGKLRIPVSLTYSSETNWTLTANNASATVMVRSVSLSVGSITGSITATPSTTTWDLRGMLAAPASIIGDSGVTQNGKLALVGGAVSIQPSCPKVAETTALCPPNDTASVYLSIAGDGTATGSGFFANLGTSLPRQELGAYSAAVNLAAGTMVMEGVFSPTSTATFAFDTVSMANLRLKVAAGDPTYAALPGEITVDSASANGGFDVLVFGDGRVTIPKISSFNLARLSVSYVNGGVVAVGTLSNKADLDGARMGSFAFFGTQTDSSVKVIGTTVRIPPQTFMLAGSLPTPRLLQDQLGMPKGDIGVYATYTNSGLIKITGVLPTSIKLPSIPRVRATINAVTLTLMVNIEPPAVGFETGFEIAANGTMSIDGNVPVAAVLAGRFVYKCLATVPVLPVNGSPAGKPVCVASQPQITLSLSAVGQNGSAVWPNVFGVSGLNLNSAAIQIGLTPGVFPYVSIGLAGSGSIPGKLREYMGIDSSAPIPVSFVLNLSAVSPCLSVTVGDPNSATPIAAFPPKSQVVTLNLFSLLVSPYGCSVGVFEVPAGVQMRGKAGVLATSVDFFGAYNPNPGGPPGLKSPQLRAWMNVANPASDKTVRIDGALRLFAAAGGWNPNPRADIIGGIRIGSAARIDIVGTCSLLGCSASGSGGVSINGFGMSMSVTVKNLGTPLILVEAVGTLRIAGTNVSLTAMIQPQTGSFSFVGSSNFPSGSILRKFDVELAHIFNPPRYVNGTPVYVPPTLRAGFRASGSLGGRFRSVSGTSGDFTTGWVDLTPDVQELRLVVSPNLDLGLITVPVTLGFVVCLSGGCAGNVTSKFSFSSSFKGIPFNIPDTDLGNDWGFAASTSAYFSGSDKVGSRWGGLKGSFSGDVSLGISSSSGLSIDSRVRVTAYVGVGGKWNSLGTYSADLDISGSGFRFCKRLSGRTICIP